MDLQKAGRITLPDIGSPAMRAFHLTWMAFFLCFFGWFGIAPLMPIIREEFGLTKAQIGNMIIASVGVTIIARLIVGWACDRFGPRLTYSLLLMLGAIPVVGAATSMGYTSLLIWRLLIGMIGASFVITQYHTSLMFAPQIVGTANATTAGWGNLGGGMTQMIMPFIYTGILALGFSTPMSWRLALLVPGILLFVMGIAYYTLTKDTMEGNFSELKAAGKMCAKTSAKGTFMMALRDRKVWILAAVYGACFGMELTMDNILALYFVDHFGASVKTAGILAGTFGLMNIFARSLGGFLSDRASRISGLSGRVKLLGLVLLCEGIGLLVFSRMTILPLAILALLVTALFVKMSNGATYAVVPFVNKRALGSVAGIVGAGGNVGAVMMGVLFRSENITWPDAILILGVAVAVISSLTLFLRFGEAPSAAPAPAVEESLPVLDAEATPG